MRHFPGRDGYREPLTSEELRALTTELSTGARNALIAIIAVLLGAAAVAAVARGGNGDDGDGGGDSIAMDTTSSSLTDTTAAPVDTTAAEPAETTSSVPPAPATTIAGGGTSGASGTTGTSGASGTTGTGTGTGAETDRSGLGAAGAGDVAGGDPVIADTGGESLLVLGLVLAAVGAVARRLSRTT